MLGCAGSGKTTFAGRLSARLKVPFHCLDDIWQTDWTAADTPKFRELLRALNASDAWVSDGNFAAVTFDLRLPRADLVIWIERPRLVCAWRAARRVFRPNEPHRLRDLPKALRFIQGFDRVNRPRIETLRAQFGPNVPVVRLTDDRQAAAFIAQA